MITYHYLLVISLSFLATCRCIVFQFVNAFSTKKNINIFHFPQFKNWEICHKTRRENKNNSPFSCSFWPCCQKSFSGNGLLSRSALNLNQKAEYPCLPLLLLNSWYVSTLAFLRSCMKIMPKIAFDVKHIRSVAVSFDFYCELLNMLFRNLCRQTDL